MARSVIDALLGRLLVNGVELELLGGLNFIGITPEPDDANNVYDLDFTAPPIAALPNLSTIQGVAVVMPAQGADLLDENQTLTADQGALRAIPELTGNRVYDLDNTNAIDEEFVYLYRIGTEAFTATIRDHANGTIATFPASTKLMGAFQKATGGNFEFRGFTRIT